MKITDEKLSAFLDAELPENEMHFIREQLAENEAIADRLAELSLVDTVVAQAYRKIDDQPLPQVVTELLDDSGSAAETLRDDDKVVSLSAWKRAKQKVSQPMTQLAVAASLVLAVTVTFMTGGKPTGEALEPILASALSSAPSGEVVAIAEHEQAIIRASFNHNNGDLCRIVDVTRSDQANQAIACRSGNQWRRVFSTEMTAGVDASDYRTATQNSSLDGYLDQHMTGSLLNREQEQQRLKNLNK